MAIVLLGLALLVGIRADDIEINKTACSAEFGMVSLENGVLSIDGFLDQPLYRCFKAIYTSNTRVVEVRSSGGTPEASLGIAEALAVHRPTVRVHNFCASACAHLLLPIASKIEADPDSIILFHHTATSTYESLGERAQESSSRFKSLSVRELALYARVGVSPWLLRAPFAAQEPVCEAIGLTVDGNASADYKARFKAVLIDRRTLMLAGLHLSSAVVDTLPELLAVAHKLPDSGAGLLAGGITYLSAPSNTGALASSWGSRSLPVLPICGKD